MTEARDSLSTRLYSTIPQAGFQFADRQKNIPAPQAMAREWKGTELIGSFILISI
jgi:hypothetical protein